MSLTIWMRGRSPKNLRCEQLQAYPQYFPRPSCGRLRGWDPALSALVALVETRTLRVEDLQDIGWPTWNPGTNVLQEASLDVFPPHKDRDGTWRHVIVEVHLVLATQPDHEITAYCSSQHQRRLRRRQERAAPSAAWMSPEICCSILSTGTPLPWRTSVIHSILSAVNGTGPSHVVGEPLGDRARDPEGERRGLGGHGGDLGKMSLNAVPDCPQPSNCLSQPGTSL